MTDKEFTIQLYDENIKAADIYLLLSDTGEVSYYNDQLITYSKDESITLMQVLLRSYLGDALYMTQIRKIIPSETPLSDSFPLVDILARFTEEGHALQANQLFSTYEPNVKSRNMLRFDIIAGVSSYLDTVNEYFTMYHEPIMTVKMPVRVCVFCPFKMTIFLFRSYLI